VLFRSDIVESHYPLGFSYIPAAQCHGNIQPTAKREFFNRIDPERPLMSVRLQES
jgi:hypothetical protein